MEIAHILEELAYDMGELPRDAIEAASTKRIAITPYLLQILEDAIVRVDEIIQDEGYQGHLYAMYLLAQFREKRAYPLLIKFFSFPGDIPNLTAGDVLTEDLCRIFASVCDSDIAPLKEVIENPNINEYVRAACLRALVTLVGCGQRPRKEVISYMYTLLNHKLEKRPSFVWDSLICCLCELYPEEGYDQIAQAFEHLLIDTTFITLEDVADVLRKNKETHLFHLFSNSELIDDTVSEMEKWLTPLEKPFST